MARPGTPAKPKPFGRGSGGAVQAKPVPLQAGSGPRSKPPIARPVTKPVGSRPRPVAQAKGLAMQREKMKAKPAYPTPYGDAARAALAGAKKPVNRLSINKVR